MRERSSLAFQSHKIYWRQKEKLRLSCVGQIYHQLEGYKSQCFDKVVRMNPEYEFLFNALLSEKKAFDPKHNDSSKLISEINEMLKDDKNNDCKDQSILRLLKFLKEEERASQ